MTSQPAIPAAHQHGACKHLKHWCRCAAAKAFECQKCSRDRFNREQAAKYAARYTAS